MSAGARPERIPVSNAIVSVKTTSANPAHARAKRSAPSCRPSLLRLFDLHSSTSAYMVNSTANAAKTPSAQ